MSQKKARRKKLIKAFVNGAVMMKAIGREEEMKKMLALPNPDDWPINIFR